MTRSRLLLAGVLLMGLAHTPAAAKDIAGVSVPDAITVDDVELKLNGAGIRKRFFVKVYIGALYLRERQTTADAVLAATPPKSMRLHVLYDEIAAPKLVQAWNEGFANNIDDAERAALEPRIARFNSLFTAVRKGDVVRLDFIGDTTEVWINQERKGAVAGPDFQRALLRIWLGQTPIDAGLKRLLLGGEDTVK